MKELAKAKKAFLDAERAKRAKEFLEGNKEAKVGSRAGVDSMLVPCLANATYR